MDFGDGRGLPIHCQNPIIDRQSSLRILQVKMFDHPFGDAHNHRSSLIRIVNFETELFRDLVSKCQSDLKWAASQWARNHDTTLFIQHVRWRNLCQNHFFILRSAAAKHRKKRWLWHAPMQSSRQLLLMGCRLKVHFPPAKGKIAKAKG